MIYDVSLEEIERLGINWNVNPHSAAITGLLNSETQVFRNAAAATTNFITDTTATGGFNLDIRTINNRADIGALLQALDNSSESKLLADPSITVGDRRQASIDIVTRVPVIALQPAEDSAAVISQVEFVDAGVKLEVTPRIGRDGTIEMQVQPTYSVVVDYVANNPVIDERKANTTVRVADGQMFVLGGLRQKNVNETVRGVPFLKDIKYVGRLFQSHDTEVRESELIVFLKPELITPYYGGTLREQRAACVGVQQLDAIPYASRRPQVCCCKDPYCPNHHPRYRINGGTSDLEMLGGWGIGGQVVAGPNAHEVIRSDEIASPAVVPMDEPVVPPATVGTPMDFGLSAPDDASTPVTSPTSDSPSHDDAYRFAPVAVEVQLP
ncbi:MAG: type II and III secretion system protein [Planctomycetota bacterium]